jgi:diadenosine tetraphosphate (Ap4A) HIT family hydrolase
MSADRLEAIERSLVEVWTEILGSKPERGDDFFASGGNSMAAVRMLTRAMSTWGVEVDLDQFFRDPTVRTLAWLLAGSPEVEPAAADRSVVGCLGCDIVAGRRPPPGGFVHETTRWVVNHVVGSMNLGTLVIAPREHVLAVADLDDGAAAELGPLVRDTTRVVEAICRPEQTYVCLWSHGDAARRHLHIAVQPVTAEVVARYGGLRSEQLQARMLAGGEKADIAEVERFCERARQEFRAVRHDRDLRP